MLNQKSLVHHYPVAFLQNIVSKIIFIEEDVENSEGGGRKLSGESATSLSPYRFIPTMTGILELTKQYSVEVKTNG